MSNQWYILREGQIVGPYSPTEIREQAKLGNIQPATRMCRDLKGAWVKAAKVQGLFEVQSAVPQNAVAYPSPPPLPVVVYPAPPPLPPARPPLAQNPIALDATIINSAVPVAPQNATAPKKTIWEYVFTLLGALIVGGFLVLRQYAKDPKKFDKILQDSQKAEAGQRR